VNIPDSVVEHVIEKYRQRSASGQQKYGKTLDRSDIDTLGWIKHAQEEAMDLVLYLERLSASITNTPNPERNDP